MDYFRECKTLADVKHTYRALLLLYHPDVYGPAGEDITKTIIAQYEHTIKEFMGAAFDAYEQDTGRRPNADSHIFAEMLRKVSELNCTVDIIGYWIYAWNAYEVRETLRGWGFWFSGKHKAWIYSGGVKNKYLRTKASLDDIKARYGIEHIRDHEDQTALPA